MELIKANRIEHEYELNERFVDQVEAIYKFNVDQKLLFDTFFGAVHPGVSCGNLQGSGRKMNVDAKMTAFEFHRCARMVFLDASGCTGKTFVTNAIRKFLEFKGKNRRFGNVSSCDTIAAPEEYLACDFFKISIP